MKKAAAGLVIIIIAVLIAVGCMPKKNDEYLRIHIRANSNSETDQNVKLEVRDNIITYLTPLLAETETVQQAKEVIGTHLTDMEKIADKVLKTRGFGYAASAEIRWEEFPARSYGELTLDKGVYQALIINLGTGEGDNWWCVAFPPLCFVPADGGANVKYKSKILELIENARKK